jgi:hypothetical protein
VLSKLWAPVLEEEGMGSLRNRAAAVFVSAWVVVPAWAADPEPEAVRVRVTAPTLMDKAFVGRLVASDDLTLRIEKGRSEGKPSTITVPRESVTRFEASRAPSRKGKGALIGILIGAGASVAVGLAAGDDCSNSPPGDDLFSRLDRNLCFDSKETGLMTAILAVPVGALIGALAAPGEKWETVDVTRVRVGVAPTRGRGLEVRLALSF